MTKKSSNKSSLKNTINKKQYLIVFIIYLLITLVIFSQIFSHIFTSAPSSNSQIYLNLWNLWWVNHALFNLHINFWHTTLLFYPIGANLIYQNLSPLSAILVAPFQLLGNVFAYNILLLISFALSGLGMFILAFYLLKNYYAAFISGVFFSFSSFHIAAAYNNLGFLAIEWIPIALFFFIQIINNEEHMFRNSIGLSISFVLASFMGDIKQGFMLILLFGVIFLIYIVKQNKMKLLQRKQLKYFIASVLIAFIIGSFGFIPYLTHLSQIVNFNSISKSHIELIDSINIFSFFIPGFYNHLFKFISSSFNYVFLNQWQKIGYIGYTALILSIYGLYRNKESRIFLVVAIIFGILSLGPFVQIGTMMIHSNVYYFIYNHIPLINVITQPSNFILIFSLMIALLSGYGIKSLEHLKIEKSKFNSFYLIFIIVIVILFLIEINGIPFMNQNSMKIIITPKTLNFFSQLNKINQSFSILYLPAFLNQNSNNPYYYQLLATYYTSISNKSIIGGYVKNENTTQQLVLLNLPLAIQSYSIQYNNQLNYVSPITENYSNQTLLLLYNYNTKFIVINRNAYNRTALVHLGGYLTTIFGKPYGITNSSIIFSTQKAFKNLYKTYVGYPQVNTWNLVFTEINGTKTKLWSPDQDFGRFKGGLLTEFAPYSNSSIINTTITFYAISKNTKSQIILAKLININNKKQLQSIKRFNVTNSLQKFSETTSLNTGQKGNLIVFLEHSNIEIKNITFSKK